MIMENNLNLENNDANDKKENTFISSVYDIVSVFVSALIVIFLVFTFLGRNMMVSGESMLPTLNNNDKVAISSFDRSYDYKDIVIVAQPNTLHKVLIKRVIATEGQTVDIDSEKGIVYVDSKPLDESYTLEPTYEKGNMKFPVTVPEGCVFVMGDNRNDSTDSRMRSVGFIDERYIMGKVMFRFSPFGQFKVE